MTNPPVISSEDPIEGSWNGFEIRVARQEDFPAMLEHLRHDFSRDEPTSKGKNLSSIVEGNVEYAKIALCSGDHLSLLAMDEATGDIAGVRISRLLSKEEAMDDASHSNDKYYGDYLPVIDIMVQLDKLVQPNIFDKYGVERLFEFRVLSVGSRFRKRGLAYEMCLRNLRLAKKEGFRLATAYFTSDFSRRVGEKLGFQLEAQILYEDYKYKGEMSFKETGGHKSCVLMSKLL